jgi:fatty acid desaturase
MEKAQLPSPAVHPSYQQHRRQLWTQILIPILAVILILLAVIVITSLATFRDNGEVERWAAISTMWIILPLLGAGLLVLIFFVALLYGMAKLLALIPPYTGQAQRLAWRIEGTVRRVTEGAVKPFFAVEGLTAAFKRLMGMK